jgi:hypothetical protein
LRTTALLLRKASPETRTPAIQHVAAYRLTNQIVETSGIIPGGSIMPSRGGSILTSVEELNDFTLATWLDCSRSRRSPPLRS